MIPRRAVLALIPAALLPALLGGCAQDPVGDYLGGFGNPIRGAAMNAPRNLSDTSIYRGNPAGAAMAAAQLEFLLRSLREDPITAPQTNPATVFALQAGVREMREALGIRPDAPAREVEQALRGAAFALRAGSTAQAEAAL
ncbi:MAG: hypothetical protein K2X11_00785, partial [Acetobacteraceae bacterium]|nr:hypothetical protein [Acetobacteraceae bacterium]